MPNNFFEFKQFTIHQDKTALKVGTDAVLLGAWADSTGTKTVLDIGTGTGILALMIAQKCTECEIDAIEIEENAAKQARENFRNCPWTNRILLLQLDFLKFYTPKKYDLIISNPPYFQHDKINTRYEKTIARHAYALSFKQLVEKSADLLSQTGKLALVFPAESFHEINKYAAGKLLYPNRCLNIQPTRQQTPKRMLVAFSKTATFFQQETLIVENSRHEYTAKFRELTADFYLDKLFQ